MEARLPKSKALFETVEGAPTTFNIPERLKNTKQKRAAGLSSCVQQQQPADELQTTRKLPKANISMTQSQARAAAATTRGAATDKGLGSQIESTKRTLLSTNSVALGDLQELADRRVGHLDERAAEIRDIILNDDSKIALKPENPLQLEESIRVILGITANSYSLRTMAQDNGSNWRWWS